MAGPYWQHVRTNAGDHLRLAGGNHEPVLTSEVYTSPGRVADALELAALSFGPHTDLPDLEVVDQRTLTAREGTLKRIDTLPGMGRSIIEHDPRSRDYPARGVLFDEDAPLVSRTWRRGDPYDQGQTPTCVPHTLKGLLNTSPASAWHPYRERSRFDPFGWYPWFQRNDEWPGESPTYEGTSGLGGCRWLKAAGLITEYRACFGLDDVLRTLSHHGPVALGLWWRASMWRTDSTGLIRYTGTMEGGHEVELNHIDTTHRLVGGPNSWGLDWGIRGKFTMSWDDLGAALADDGDAYTLVA